MPTQLIRSLSNIKPAERGGVLTIGNFDGVHLGHQQLIAAMRKKATALGVATTVVTFEPHPVEFFAKTALTIPRLTRLREKMGLLTALGVDYVLVLPFKQQLADISASRFVTDVLGLLAPRHIVIGDDFHFGQKRQGNLDLLQSMGATLGFTVEALPTFLVEDERVSSTRIRLALREGNHALANKLLGRPYTMLGCVRPGDQLGRKLGYPTANLFVHRRLTPVNGIYIVSVHGVSEQPWPGVANVGTRPTVDGTRTLLEVHLLDFDQDIYGRHVEVEFIKKLRDEERYASLDILQAQIAKDVLQGREYFKKQDSL